MTPIEKWITHPVHHVFTDLSSFSYMVCGNDFKDSEKGVWNTGLKDCTSQSEATFHIQIHNRTPIGSLNLKRYSQKAAYLACFWKLSCMDHGLNLQNIMAWSCVMPANRHCTRTVPACTSSQVRTTSRRDLAYLKCMYALTRDMYNRYLAAPLKS